MAKIGPNAPCPCGRPKKYKKCCGSPALSNAQRKRIDSASMLPIQEEVNYLLQRSQADELNRQAQQGLGRPIISSKFGDRMAIAVGDNVIISSKAKTFPDFLYEYLPKVIGTDWAQNEFKKAPKDRHPILQWNESFQKFVKKHADEKKNVWNFEMSGIASCYLGLAYSLYLMEHNIELQKRFVKRLHDINNFQGAYYELIVANCLIRLGFELTLEDETDDTSGHCEFSATSKKTGKKYWVEAKARSVVGVLGKTEINGTTDKDPTGVMSKHISDALKKPANGERLIFVDLNAPGDFQATPGWVEKAGRRLDSRDKSRKPEEVAYIFVTNMNFHYHLNEVARPHGVLAHGLGIPDFAKVGFISFREKYKQKQKHIDAFEILQSFGEYPKVPSTFDGRIPSEAFGDGAQPIKIGESYFFDSIGENGAVSRVTTATVAENEKTMYIGTECGSILTRKMSDEELRDYRVHKDTYFGVYQRQSTYSEDPYDFFEKLVEIHKNFPREYFLKNMRSFPDHQMLEAMPLDELVLMFCEALSARSASRKLADPSAPVRGPKTD